MFGAGCFWCTEAVFKQLKGVQRVEPGYAGGNDPNPTYEQVGEGDSGYVEVARVDYDPDKIAYRDLLTVFFASHDPTQVGGQGADIGDQYRSVVFYTTEDQQKEAEAFVDELNVSNEEGEPLTTTVEPLTNYHSAEEYHHDYYEKNRSAPYCQLVINPKLENVQKEFAHLLAK